MTYQLANTVGISSIGDFHDAGKKMSNGCVQYRYNHVQSLNQLKPPSLIAPRHKQTLPMWDVVHMSSPTLQSFGSWSRNASSHWKCSPRGFLTWKKPGSEWNTPQLLRDVWMAAGTICEVFFWGYQDISWCLISSATLCSELSDAKHHSVQKKSGKARPKICREILAKMETGLWDHATPHL